ncbi:MAG: glycosyltransferase family A protein [Sphingomonas sp.]|jgi:glycosyltransferase involved in cell wall biosynthesis|uniref:glycosyltransferase family 2 protein n=1 Tax=Sphingomonas sp. TaxID=28214 RepID=UPI003568226B
MSTPIVSVVMAAYNGAGLVGETLATLQAQTLTDFELLVVDDRSTDDTLAVLRSWDDPRFRVIAAETNQGVVRSRNRAFAAARGRYIAALDHDDLCYPERFARQVAYLDAHPDTVLAGTASDNLQDGVITPSTLAPLTTPPLIEWLLRIENPLVWSSVMIRTDAARRMDIFQRPEMVFAEDYDLYHRIAKFGRIARLDDVLVTYRKHSGSASHTHISAMTNRATDVLAADYAGVFGDEAADYAALIVRHVMGRMAVPDRTTLRLVGEAIIRLQDDFLARVHPDPESRALIRWETARRWARIGEIGLRSGTLRLADAAAVRPDHLGLGYAGINELILSRILGSARAVRRRLQARAAG